VHSARRHFLTYAAGAALFVLLSGIVGGVIFIWESADTWIPFAFVTSLAGALLLLGAAAQVVVTLFRNIERLRGHAVSAAGAEEAVPLPLPADDENLEIARLRAGVADLATRLVTIGAAPDERLQAVLATSRDAVIVVTESGQVSLVNYAGKHLLGADKVKVGTSVFAALQRGALDRAIDASAAQKRPVEAVLLTADGDEVAGAVTGFAEHGGAVIWIASDAAEHRAELDHDLQLHDRPPETGAATGATPLDSLPMLVFDCETTGLDVTADRIVSIGAVRLHGPRLYRSIIFDRLVNPGQLIPSASIAIHGITDEMVGDAESFPPVYAAFEELRQGAALMGYNVLFDLAMLERECKAAGLPWSRPQHLDLLRLAVALEPDCKDMNLEALAERCGVEIRGRHTALGDSLVTAEVYQILLPRLLDEGIETLEAAIQFSLRAKEVVRRQQAMGW